MFSNTISWITLILLAITGWVGAQPVGVPSIADISQSSITAEVIRVIDGDTIEVRFPKNQAVTRVRYIGIDTPEPYAHSVPDCGSHEATLRNEELVAGAVVTLVPGTDAYDTYGRLLAYVYVDGVFVNQTLLEEGWARMLMIRPNTDQYAYFTMLQGTAQKSNLGIWGMCPRISR